MSALNESLVLDYVREHDGSSRSTVAGGLGLSAATVSRIVSRLTRTGLITVEAQVATGRGRPAARLRFNRRAGCVLAVDLGGTKCHGVLADLSGEILVEDVRPTDSDGSPYDTLLAVISDLSDTAPSPVAAAAVGVPAIVDPETGFVLGGPNVRWRDFPLLEELRRAVDVPILVDNDVKLAAVAQAWRGLGRGVPDFATISIGTGVGAAIVANGELVRGRNNAAGELGYLLVDPRQLGQEHALTIGGLEEVISGPAIAARAKALMAAGTRATNPVATPDAGTVTSEDVLAAARAGDPIAGQVLDEVLDTLTIALVALSAMSDPTLIIIDGGVGRSLAPDLDRLRASLARHTPWTPQLATSELGPSATVIGAIATALWLDRRRSVPTLDRSIDLPAPMRASV
jgi:glucokinase